MTPEAQRIAIAEACLNTVEWHDDMPYWKGSWSAVGEGNEYLAEFSPLFDLNACHEMEATLDANQQVTFGRHLARLGTTHHCIPGDDTLYVNWGASYGACHATAPQRCEAFLRTLNLWTADRAASSPNK